jgi:hypothetical protein
MHVGLFDFHRKISVVTSTSKGERYTISGTACTKPFCMKPVSPSFQIKTDKFLPFNAVLGQTDKKGLFGSPTKL